MSKAEGHETEERAHWLIGLAEHRIGWISDDKLAYLQRLKGTEPGGDIAAATRKLVAEAEGWLEAAPFTVTGKREAPPSLDKHDYMSLSIYHWPNPATPDGLPYVTRDGQVNPEVERYDRPAMAGTHDAVEALTLAFALTGEERYAAKSVDFLDAWFVDQATRMNPNMLYAQYIPGHSGFDTPVRYPAVYVPGVEGHGIYVAFGGMIEGVRLVPVINLLPLLEPSPYWTPRISDGMKRWCRDFLHWMLHHQHGKDEAGCLNNHGSWYCVQALAHALHSEDLDAARSIVRDRVPERIAMQIEPDGSMPEELGRANAFHYVVFGLTSFFNLAVMAEKLDVDLWHYATPDGRGIRRALDWLMPYLDNPGAWPGKVTKPVAGQLSGAVPLLHMAWRAYGDERYLRVLRRIRPDPDDHRNRLLFGQT